MFDHVGLKVQDLARSVAFYRAALGALGHEMGSSGDDYAGFGPKVSRHCGCMPMPAGPAAARTWRCARRTARRWSAFHAQGLAAGGRDNGAPGPRPDYGDNYYAAFLLDPDGHNIEAVCFK